ncbi:unnamed protein product [Didymodactylos carnosus]|uniref:HTH psq-type domain-containing protein n=1 Tax=Didymodactylos carnosus TaxID=1234261 RepID=A0A8S2D164_9BILA|nr:unnamed protein product [Didymodactylos carnosus]CAF3600374.1 unnamed protein product [Didymodactylos carnosus]
MSRKRNQQYSLNDLLQAVQDVKAGKSQRQASMDYKIPIGTIKSRMSRNSTGAIGRPTVLSQLQEQQFVMLISIFPFDPMAVSPDKIKEKNIQPTISTTSDVTQSTVDNNDISPVIDVDDHNQETAAQLQSVHMNFDFMDHFDMPDADDQQLTTPLDLTTKPSGTMSSTNYSEIINAPNSPSAINSLATDPLFAISNVVAAHLSSKSSTLVVQ